MFFLGNDEHRTPWFLEVSLSCQNGYTSVEESKSSEFESSYHYLDSRMFA